MIIVELWFPCSKKIKHLCNKSAIYRTLAGLATQRVLKTGVRGITGYFQGFRGLWGVKGGEADLASSV